MLINNDLDINLFIRIVLEIRLNLRLDVTLGVKETTNGNSSKTVNESA